ncbi:general stress protein [Alkalicoccus urumqiensis]|uniref:General stress protein n=1 Tax=Alkalicoccus urumqiensis TaxID=1548213 RepID=A0A2P6MI72_ALKUR|nr:general stress protein [Alkalicoccus urumqiensis]PRO65986.1 general stress protein [Alkalicoccus urumqiensis]
MQPLYKEFYNDEEVVDAVQGIKEKGVSEDDIYVLTHDSDRTDRVADNADANTLGVNDMNFGTAAKNIFRKKGDELRAKFEELGFSKDMANELEEKLDQGKVIVVIPNAPDGMTL